MKIGFLSNQLDNRGTGDALYKYAHYNEELLGNTSSIFTYFGNPATDKEAQDRFIKRFGGVYNVSDGNFNDIDALYHIKSGYDDGFRPPNNIPYLVHAVFDNQPHGTVYATISPWMGERFNLPYVPHIVELFDTSNNFRERWDIPEDHVVFGRYGGLDTFDIPFVWRIIDNVLRTYPNTHFIFMNTNEPDLPWVTEHPRIKFLPGTVDPYTKRVFINTCDAMLHARSRGETFGLSVGEFAVAGKPVITFSESPEKAHLQELGPFALTYKDNETLFTQLSKVIQGPMVSWGYGNYTPYNVMRKFDEVFLHA